MKQLVVALLVCGMLPSAAAQAQEKPPLRDLPIEQLLGIKVESVFGASERLQPVTEAPTSVTIVTAEQIKRYGYRTLADVLRGTRGFFVTSDRNYSYIGVHGFNQPGDYNTRVLLLVNGHKINDNVYDQASIGPELALDAEMFERVEIIRGPASALYGTSALFGVINVILKRGAALDGLTIGLDAGTLGTVMGRISYGRAFGNGFSVAAAATYERSDGVRRLYFSRFDTPDQNNGWAEDLDGERSASFYTQLEWRGLTLTVTDGERRKDIPTASFSTVFNSHAPRERTTDRRFMGTLEYARVIRGTRFTGSASFDRLSYQGRYPFDGPSVGSSNAVVVNHDEALGARWGLHGRATRALSAHHTLTLGGEFYDNFTQRQSSTYDDPSLPAFLSDASSHQSALYAQHEWRARPWLILSGGLRHDWYPRFHRTTPKATVIVLPNANTSLKYVYGRGFRAPNAYELYYYEDASGRLSPEHGSAHALVWEQYLGPRVRTVLSTYRAEASDVIALVRADNGPMGLGFSNRESGVSRGASGEVEVKLPSGFELSASASRHRVDDENGQRLPNSPEWTAALRFGGPIAVGRTTASVESILVSSRRTISGTIVDGAVVTSATIVSPLSERVELLATLRNLFNARYFDPASAEHAVDMIQQNGRSARIGLRLTLGNRAQ